jgi:hypothetical protein
MGRNKNSKTPEIKAINYTKHFGAQGSSKRTSGTDISAHSKEDKPITVWRNRYSDLARNG